MNASGCRLLGRSSNKRVKLEDSAPELSINKPNAVRLRWLVILHCHGRPAGFELYDIPGLEFLCHELLLPPMVV